MCYGLKSLAIKILMNESYLKASYRETVNNVFLGNVEVFVTF